MRALTLAGYSLKRVSRNRPLWFTMFALPLLFALVRCIFPGMEIFKACVWVCPAVCLGLVVGVLWVQLSMDRASGLEAGFRSAAVSQREMLVSRIVAGGVVFVVQMAVMVGVLVVRF